MALDVGPLLQLRARHGFQVETAVAVDVDAVATLTGALGPRLGRKKTELRAVTASWGKRGGREGGKEAVGTDERGGT